MINLCGCYSYVEWFVYTKLHIWVAQLFEILYSRTSTQTFFSSRISYLIVSLYRKNWRMLLIQILSPPPSPLPPPPLYPLISDVSTKSFTDGLLILALSFCSIDTKLDNVENYLSPQKHWQVEWCRKKCRNSEGILFLPFRGNPMTFIIGKANEIKLIFDHYSYSIRNHISFLCVFYLETCRNYGCWK